MLYDPKWEVKAAPLATWNLQRFIAWLETKNPNQEYHYSSPWSCAVAQYLESVGEKETVLFSHQIPEPFHQIVWTGQGCVTTFGAALERARAIRR